MLKSPFLVIQIPSNPTLKAPSRRIFFFQTCRVSVVFTEALCEALCVKSQSRKASVKRADPSHGAFGYWGYNDYDSNDNGATLW